MSTVYVQFSDATETRVISVFGCPQSASVPNQASIDSSDARYQAFINPAPTLAQRAAAAAVAGLGIALNGSITLAETTFPTDPVTQGKIAAMAAMAGAGSLPTGFTTYDMRDAAGGWHHFTAAQYLAVANAIADYVAVCTLIADGSPNAPTALPAASVSLTL